MSESTGVKRWITEAKVRPLQASAGFALGLFWGAVIEYLQQFRVDRHSFLDQLEAVQDSHRILSALVQIAFFVWFLRVYKTKNNPWEIFVFSFFGGVLLVVLAYTLWQEIVATK